MGPGVDDSGLQGPFNHFNRASVGVREDKKGAEPLNPRGLGFKV